MDMGLNGKVAIVTGAARGIGAGIARSLAEEGACVVISDINAEGAVATARALSDAGLAAVGIGGDVTNVDDVEAAVSLAGDTFGSVDIVVNNAALTRDGFLTRMSEEDFDLVTGIILKGAFLLTRAAVPHMIANQWGRIVNVASRAIYGNVGQANYAAGKAGLIGFTKAMALEQGRYNITANAVAPGFTETEMTTAHPNFEKIREAAIRGNAVPRVGQPEDIAAAVTFLASEHGRYITGETLHVTGGRYG
ncbi:glucose 1-dehydrogenase [Salipiger sp.]|uniref:glucose 1-dehydrogenase n=1 Tax=Salipiger sp. TaxID=2078585 RepID=UPI003A97985F